jgi:hypothetical protein
MRKGSDIFFGSKLQAKKGSRQCEHLHSLLVSSLRKVSRPTFIQSNWGDSKDWGVAKESFLEPPVLRVFVLGLQLILP